MLLFSCVDCPERFALSDVENGKYFPSTGMCISCYRKRFKNRSLCFGKKSMYDPNTIACGEECPDRRICKGFVKHRKEFTKTKEIQDDAKG